MALKAGMEDCPRCKGVGQIKTKHGEVKEKIRQAESLIKRGYTYEQVAVRLGYKHKSGVSKLLSRNKAVA